MRSVNAGLIGVLLALPGLGACQMMRSMWRLRDELYELENHILIVTGYVTNDSGLPGRAIAVLMEPAPEEPGGFAVAAYKSLQNDRERFVFHLEDEDSILVAFLDVNGDLRHNEGEPISKLASAPLRTHFTLDRSHWLLNELHLSRDEGAAPEFALEVEGDSLPSMLFFASNVGRVTTFDDPFFDDDKVTMGLWEPLRFTREVGYGFYLLEPWNPKRDVLLLIHGLSASPRAWRDLVPQLDLTRFQVVLFHYPSGLPLEKSAQLLSDSLSEMHLRSRGRRVRLVGHSVGGLIARRFLQMQEERGFADARLDRFLSISTPWAGLDSARSGVERSPVVVPVWRDIATDSEFLRALHAWPLPEGLDYSLLFSYAGHSDNQSVANDGVVSLASQLDYRLQDLAIHLYGLEEGHASILSSPRTAAFINRELLAD